MSNYVSMKIRAHGVVLLILCNVSLLACKSSSSYPEIQLDDFIHSLANVTATLMKRDRSELICSLAFTLSAQGMARHISKSLLRPSYSRTEASICNLVSCKNLALGMRLAEIVYDPQAKTDISRDFEIISYHKEAEFLKPSFLLMRSRMEAVTWIVIRGTTSLGDLLTDLRTTSEPYLDGMVHQGILRAAGFIFERVRKHLLKSDRIWLTGHSLGAATAAICTGPCNLAQSRPVSHSDFLDCIQRCCAWPVSSPRQ
jgi:hypothetical protein